MFLQCPKCGKGGGNRLQRGGALEHLLSYAFTSIPIGACPAGGVSEPFDGGPAT